MTQIPYSADPRCSMTSSTPDCVDCTHSLVIRHLTPCNDATAAAATAAATAAMTTSCSGL